MRTIAGFVAGTIVGTGLIVSGMSEPAKVLNFLDIFGAWDASLAFVMLGAIAVAFAGFRLAPQLRAPVFAREFAAVHAEGINSRLLAGSALFGIGWGLAGFCPGPAIVALASGSAGVFLFAGAMIAGMWIANALPGGLRSQSPIVSSTKEAEHA